MLNLQLRILRPDQEPDPEISIKSSKGIFCQAQNACGTRPHNAFPQVLCILLDTLNVIPLTCETMIEHIDLDVSVILKGDLILYFSLSFTQSKCPT